MYFDDRMKLLRKHDISQHFKQIRRKTFEEFKKFY